MDKFCVLREFLFLNDDLIYLYPPNTPTLPVLEQLTIYLFFAMRDPSS
jgi:hypothetical protein